VLRSLNLKLEEWSRRRGPPSDDALAEIDRMRKQILGKKFETAAEIEVWIAEARDKYERRCTVENARSYMCSAWILRELGEDLSAALAVAEAG
jgi:hypothetical protein